MGKFGLEVGAGLGFEFWILDFGLWILDWEFQGAGRGSSVSDFEFQM